MKLVASFILMFLLACNDNEPSSDSTSSSTSKETSKDSVVKEQKKEPVDEPNKQPPTVTKKYFNQRFRDVTVEKVSDDKYRIRGEGQIFEANF